MQLKLLREHYKTVDGITWEPKKSFNTKSEVIKTITNYYKYDIYTCGICNNLHISDTKKGSK